jgi:hypothetical protein
MSAHLRAETITSNAVSIRSFIHVGVRELRAAAIAQAIGVVGFVSAAVIYGLVVLPAPEVPRSVAPPTDYQLTPTPATTPPGDKQGAGDKGGPDLISSWESVQNTKDVAALNTFINKFPNSQFTDAAWRRLSQLIQEGALEVAGENAGLDVIATVLQHTRDSPSAPLESIVNHYSLREKYPLGFALFYSDGRQVLYYGDNLNSNTAFDPANIKVVLLSKFQLCFSGFRWNGPGGHIIMGNNCIGLNPGSKMSLLVGRQVSVSFESLATSPSGAAWVIGLHY